MRRYRWLPPTPGHTIQVAGATYAHGDEITTETALEHPWLTELETAKETRDLFTQVEEEALKPKKARTPKKPLPKLEEVR